MTVAGALKKFLRSKHIQLALVSGASIIALAWVSKRVLPEPMDNLWIALPGLMVVCAEATLGAKRRAWYTNGYGWMVAIAAATAGVILLHLL
jgi:hypothetical protein